MKAKKQIESAEPGNAGTADDAAKTLFVRGLSLTGFGLALGLTLEALIGYKTPAYLQDPLRRELFRLAHAHLALLGMLVALCALGLQHWRAQVPARVNRALLAGAILLPLGFFLGGARHPEGDPGVGVWLAPPGALLALYGLAGVIAALRSSESAK
jgi:hypothetical protein